VTAEEKKKDTSRLAPGRRVPEEWLAQLQKDAVATVSRMESRGVGTLTCWARRIRACRWPNQYPDERKWGDSAWPYEGASDAREYVAEEAVRDLAAMDVVAAATAQLSFGGVAGNSDVALTMAQTWHDLVHGVLARDWFMQLSLLSVRLHGDGTGVVQRAVVAEKIHVSRNKNREKCPHHHAGSERNAVNKLILTCRKTGHHQVVVFHRELVRERSAEHVEPERPAERTQQHVMAQVIERGKLKLGCFAGMVGRGIRGVRHRSEHERKQYRLECRQNFFHRLSTNSQNLTALSSHPSATVPVPRPKPWENPFFPHPCPYSDFAERKMKLFE